MPFDPDDITEANTADHMTDGNTPIIGVSLNHADLVGVPLSQSPQGVCGLLKWMEAQTNRSFLLQLTFRSDGSHWKLTVVNPNNGNIVKTLGDKMITGKTDSDLGFAERHERLGYLLLRKVARRIANQLGL